MITEGAQILATDSEPCEECGAVMTWIEGDNVAGWIHEHNPHAPDCYTAYRWSKKAGK